MNRKDEFITRMVSAMLVAERPDVHDDAQRAQALKDLADVVKELRQRLAIARDATDFASTFDQISEHSAYCGDSA
jgi:putative heme iron utilization protein